MRRINRKSDFDFLLHLTGSDGRDVGIPPRVTLVFSTGSYSTYEASVRDDVYTNCYNDGGVLHVVMNSHKLSCGVLRCEIREDEENNIYPDGYKLTVSPTELDFELVNDKGDDVTAAEAELILPYIRGEAFTYDMFTAEQIAELQAPAREMIEKLEATDKAVKEAEEARVSEFNELSDKSIAATEKADKAAENASNMAELAKTEGERAKSYADHPAKIGDNGNWWVWNGEEYVDTQSVAHIGDYYPEFYINERMELVVTGKDGVRTDFFEMRDGKMIMTF